MSEPAWRRYLRLRGRDVRRDIDDEFEFHIETRAAEYERAGIAPAEARQRATREMGDVEGAKRRCRQIGEQQARRQQRGDVLDAARHDVRFALRAMARSPGFATVAVLTLALGIGATTAIFGVVHGILLRPLPFAEPGRLVRIWEISPRGDDRNPVSPGNYVDWRTRSTAFAGMGAHRSPYGIALSGDGDAIQVRTADITPSVTRLLGVRPLLGRTFTAEDALGRSHGSVVLLGEGLWRRRFGEDRRVIGRRIILNGVPCTVVGVMPGSFDFPDASADAWVPVADAEINPAERRSHTWGVVARLRPGVSLDRARVELRSIAASLAREHPQAMTGWGVNVVPLHRDLVAGVRPLLVVLFCGALVVLAIVCANLANLLLVRAIGRDREMALRAALGADQGRIVRQLLTESVVLGTIGGALGVAVAVPMLRALIALAPPDIPLLDEVRIDPAGLAFAAGATVVSVVVFGLIPALRFARGGGRWSLQSVLRAANDRTGGVQHVRLRSALLVGEVALSLVLMVGAGLLVRSFQRLRAIDHGYRTDGLLALSLDLPRARYATTERHIEFYARLIGRLRHLPGVTAAGAMSELPGHGGGMTFSFAVEGRPSANPNGRGDPELLHVVTPDLFRTLGIPLRRGRAFDDRDVAAAPPVVIVNETLARHYWPDEDPVGRRIALAGPQGPWLEVVGVVGDTRMTGSAVPPPPILYRPHAQKPWPWLTWMMPIIRVEPGRDPLALVPAIRALVAELDADLPIHRTATVAQLYAEGTARRRFALTLIGAFAVVALLLGTIGMYGVLSFTVAQREQEIGIRIALGASARQLVRGVMRQALGLAFAGIVIGIAASTALTRLMTGLLYEVSPNDPATLGAVSLLIAVVAALAAWIPARRATGVDPIRVMRRV